MPNIKKGTEADAAAMLSATGNLSRRVEGAKQFWGTLAFPCCDEHAVAEKLGIP